MDYRYDHYIKMLGAFTLVIMLLGAAFTEGDTEELDRIFWADYEKDAKITGNYFSESDYRDEDEDEPPVEVEIGTRKDDAYNLVKIEFMLMWDDSDNIPGNDDTGDEFSLEITPPANVEIDRIYPDWEVSQRAINGHITITVFVQDMPENRASDNPLIAKSEDDALDQLTSDRGRGVWRASVQCEDAGDTTIFPTDEGEDFNLQVAIHQYVINSVYDPSESDKK